METVRRFIEECCLTGDRYKIQATELYRAYHAWCDQTGEGWITQKEFGMRLTEHGFRNEKHGIYWWYGITLHHDTADEKSSEAKEDD